MSGVAPSTSTRGSRRRAAAMASPSFVCAFSRTRNASSSAWKVLRSTSLGAPSLSLVMSFIALSLTAVVLRGRLSPATAPSRGRPLCLRRFEHRSKYRALLALDRRDRGTRPPAGDRVRPGEHDAAGCALHLRLPHPP